jgi:hypothetical protein
MTFNRSPDDGEKYFARPTDDLDKQIPIDDSEIHIQIEFANGCITIPWKYRTRGNRQKSLQAAEHFSSVDRRYHDACRVCEGIDVTQTPFDFAQLHRES